MGLVRMGWRFEGVRTEKWKLEGAVRTEKWMLEAWKVVKTEKWKLEGAVRTEKWNSV